MPVVLVQTDLSSHMINLFTTKFTILIRISGSMLPGLIVVQSLAILSPIKLKQQCIIKTKLQSDGKTTS